MENLNDNLQYFKQMRDDSLEHFNDLIKQYGLYSEEQLHKSLDTVLRKCKQLKLLEDIKIAHTISNDRLKLVEALSEIKNDDGEPYFNIEYIRKNLIK